MTPSRPPLTEGAVGKTLFVFALPILGANVLQSLNGSVNAVWVGRYLGSAGLTAMSNVNTIVFFLVGLVFGIAMATSILVGQSMGAQDTEAAKRIVGTSATFFVAVSLATALVGLLLAEPILVAMRTPPDALPLAVICLRIISIALPILFFTMFLAMVLRGSGDARTPLLFSLLGVVLDIILNPILMLGVGPVPRLGIAGSACATLISGSVALVALLLVLYTRKHPLRLGRGELSYLRPDRAILGALVKKGLPMGLSMIVMTSSAIAMLVVINGFGTDTTAAYGAALQLWNYIQMPSYAVGMAVSTMAAQNVGARRWDRVLGIARAGVVLNVVMTGALAAIVTALGRVALGLFVTDPVVIGIGVHLNTIIVWSFVINAIPMVLAGVVRSTGAVMVPLLTMIVSLWLIRLPFAVAMSARYGIEAAWWSFPLAATMSALLSLGYYRYGNWRNATMLSGQAAPARP